jgi:NADH:ubiquinone oxidoreductase subunit 2 (subunit N)
MLTVQTLSLAGLCLVLPTSYTLFDSFHFTPLATGVKIAILLLYAVFQIFCIITTPGLQRAQFSSERLLFQYAIIFATLLMTGAADPMMVFILLEIISFASIGLTVLAGTRSALEAGLKALLYGAVAAAFLVISFIFNGSFLDFFQTGLEVFTSQFYVGVGSTGAVAGAFMFLLGFFIKFGLGPFSSWVVATYEAAIYKDFVFLAVFGKLAALIAFVKFIPYMLGSELTQVFALLFVLFAALHATITMAKQQLIRRFFAYSSIFNYSLCLLAFVTIPGYYVVSVAYLFYYAVASLLTYVAFAIFVYAEEVATEPTTLSQLRTLNTTYGAGLAFASSLIFNSGLPPFGIFLMKAILVGLLPTVAVGASFHLFSLMAIVGILYISLVNIYAYFRAFGYSVKFYGSGSLTMVRGLATTQYALLVFFTILVLFFLPLTYLWAYWFLY